MKAHYAITKKDKNTIVYSLFVHSYKMNIIFKDKLNPVLEVYDGLSANFFTSYESEIRDIIDRYVVTIESEIKHIIIINTIKSLFEK